MLDPNTTQTNDIRMNKYLSVNPTKATVEFIKTLGNPKFEDSYGRQPLAYFIAINRDVSRYLMEQGCNPLHRDKCGMTAIVDVPMSMLEEYDKLFPEYEIITNYYDEEPLVAFVQRLQRIM